MKKTLSIIISLIIAFAGITPISFAASEIEAASLSLGAGHSAVIKEDGSLWVWGSNVCGQIGNGTTDDSSVPIKIMEDVACVSLGYYHSAAIKEDGSLWMWGNNECGQLGNGTEDNSSIPVKIMEGVVSVSLGGSHSAAIKADGSLWMWGDNEYGQVGNGTEDKSSIPVKIMEGVVSVSLGGTHSAAIKKDRSLWLSGLNYYGQIGNGESGGGMADAVCKPIKIMKDVVSVSLGNSHSAAIKADGSLWMWGKDDDFNLGIDGNDGRGTPEPIKIMEDVVSVSLGVSHSAAIKKDGSLWRWGLDYAGTAGVETEQPTKIMENIELISMGHNTNAVITKDGVLWMWGDNYYGQIGNGATDMLSVPIKIMDGVRIPKANNVSEKQEQAQYIYDEKDAGESVDVLTKAEDVIDESSAKEALKKASQELSDEQKRSSTGVDKLTVLAEEAVASSATKEINDEILHITEPIVKELEPVAERVAEVLDETLTDNGVNTQRVISKTVRVKTPRTGVVKVRKDSANTSVDKVNIQTNFAKVTVDSEAETAFSLESKGENKIAVTFDTEKTITMKISFPGIEGDTAYIAVVDEKGNPIGGKYNPATGNIEAKISKSGVYEVVYNEKDFTDIKNKSTEMQKAIKTLAAKGIINGTGETTFSPDDTISRAEVAALVVRTISKLDPNEDGGFADVTRSNWYYGVAGSSKKHGIINGYDDNTFRGDSIIAKDQIVAVSARVLKNEMNYKTPQNIESYLTFADASELAQWSRGDIALANMANLIMHRTDNRFEASELMSRGDAAIILMRLFNKIW